MQNRNSKNLNSLGQTLIETLAALFILVMGVSAAVGLAIYAFGASSTVLKQIIATGLAREGLEAVRNMRDTNWLNDALVANGCYNFDTSTSLAADCYVNWLGDLNLSQVPFCLNPTNNEGNCVGSATTRTYFLGQDGNDSNYWTLSKDSNNFGLRFNDPKTSAAWQQYGFYSSAGGVSCDSSSGNSDFCRTIILTKISNTAPYNLDANLLLLKVQSQVWWTDKKCPRVDQFSKAPAGCKLELDSFLTNWKN